MAVQQLTPRELYDTYAGNADPASIIEVGRTDLATRLRVEEGLSQRDAYYAADQMLVHAQELVEGQGS